MMAAGVSEGRLVHIRPGIVPISRMAVAKRRRLRAAHGIPETGRMVLFPGDYEFSRAAETVSRTVPLLAETHPRITVVFACRIKRPPSIAIRDRIKREIAATGAGERVCFLDKVDDMAAFVGSADVVIMPSESLFAKMDVPLVLLEAMSQQVPLVLADVPPLNELLGFGVGVGIPPADERALAEAIGTLIDSPSRAAEMGDAGEAAVRELFNAKRMAAAVETVYDEVLQL
jgi:glycosyltransferase involved in cell wall biosynthesis